MNIYFGSYFDKLFEFSYMLMQWVLSSKEINFPYPLALTLLHMIFSSILCFILIKVFKVLWIIDFVRLALSNNCIVHTLIFAYRYK